MINSPENKTHIPDTNTLTEWEEAEIRRQLTVILETIEDGRVEYLDYLDAYIKDSQERHCVEDGHAE